MYEISAPEIVLCNLWAKHVFSVHVCMRIYLVSSSNFPALDNCNYEVLRVQVMRSSLERPCEKGDIRLSYLTALYTCQVQGTPLGPAMRLSSPRAIESDSHNCNIHDTSFPLASCRYGAPSIQRQSFLMMADGCTEVSQRLSCVCCVEQADLTVLQPDSLFTADPFRVGLSRGAP